MQKESQTYKIAPAERLASVSEYYFSKKLKEVAQMNAEGKDIISLGIGSPDMPPSKVTIETLCNNATDTVTNRMWAYRNSVKVSQPGINAGMEWN
mgnify:CR=1 FL=1